MIKYELITTTNMFAFLQIIVTETAYIAKIPWLCFITFCKLRAHISNSWDLLHPSIDYFSFIFSRNYCHCFSCIWFSIVFGQIILSALNVIQLLKMFINTYIFIYIDLFVMYLKCRELCCFSFSTRMVCGGIFKCF